MVEVDTHPAVLAARDAKETKWVAVGREAPWPSAEVVEASGNCHPAPVQLADGRWVGTRVDPTTFVKELVVLDGKTRRGIPFAREWEPMSTVRVAPAGDRVLVTMKVGGRGHVVEHALDGSGTWTTVMTAYDPNTPSHLYGNRENIWGADYVGIDHVAIRVGGSSSELALVRRTSDGWTEVSRIKASGFDPVAIDTMIILRTDKRVEAFAAVGDALVKLGCKLDHMAFLVYPADRRAHLWGHRGAGRDGHVLVGVAEALAGAKPKRTKKT